MSIIRMFGHGVLVRELKKCMLPNEYLFKCGLKDNDSVNVEKLKPAITSSLGVLFVKHRENFSERDSSN